MTIKLFEERPGRRQEREREPQKKKVSPVDTAICRCHKTIGRHSGPRRSSEGSLANDRVDGALRIVAREIRDGNDGLIAAKGRHSTGVTGADLSRAVRVHEGLWRVSHSPPRGPRDPLPNTARAAREKRGKRRAPLASALGAAGREKDAASPSRDGERETPDAHPPPAPPSPLRRGPTRPGPWLEAARPSSPHACPQ